MDSKLFEGTSYVQQYLAHSKSSINLLLISNMHVLSVEYSDMYLFVLGLNTPKDGNPHFLDIDYHIPR